MSKQTGPEKKRLEGLIDRVERHYVANPKQVALRNEYGFLVWEDTLTEDLIDGRHVLGPSQDRVDLYTDTDRQEVIDQRYLLKRRTYVGDFHAHLLGQGTWIGQFPSPQDIVNADISVAGSKWKLQTPFAGQTDLDIAPCFQLVQSLKFGGMFVIEHGADWKEFGDLAEQATCLGEILQCYSDWHQSAAARLGGIPNNASEIDFATIVDSELPAMNNCLLGRTRIRLHRLTIAR